MAEQVVTVWPGVANELYRKRKQLYSDQMEEKGSGQTRHKDVIVSAR